MNPPARKPRPQAANLRLVLVANLGHTDPTKGAGQRTQLLFEALRAVGPTGVAVIAGKRQAEPTLAERFPGARRLHAVRAARPWRPSFRPTRALATLRRLARPRGPDAALRARLLALAAPEPAVTVFVFRYLPLARASGLSSDPVARRVVVVDLDDREDVVAEGELAQRLGSAGWLARPALGLMRRRQASDLSGASRVYLVGPEDEGGLPPGVVRVVPNTPVVPAEAEAVLPPSQGQDVLFVGTLGWPPNHDAAAWVLAQVWPRLAPAFPGSRLRIVGRGDPGPLRDLVGRLPRVEVHADAPSLAPHYAAARVALSPVAFGGGSKIKVIEACAWGRPVVARSHSARGYGPELARRLVVAEDGPGFAAAVARYLSEPDLADRDGAALRAIQASHFARDAVRDRVSADLAALAARCAEAAA